jgi:hypothetical protein
MVALKLSCINRLLFIKSNIHYVKNLAPMVQTFCYLRPNFSHGEWLLGVWRLWVHDCTCAKFQVQRCVGAQILSHFGVDSKLWHHSIWHHNDVVLTCWVINVLVIDMVLTCQTINPHINDVALMCQTINPHIHDVALMCQCIWLPW